MEYRTVESSHRHWTDIRGQINTKGAIVYFLFFAGPNQTGENIVEDIFRKYKNRSKREG
jgi:hypothetical protein